MKWIALSEKCPKRGQTVLAFWPGAQSAYMPRSFAVVTYSSPGHWHHPDDDEDDYTEPSHWMPLPDAPKQPHSTGGEPASGSLSSLQTGGNPEK